MKTIFSKNLLAATTLASSALLGMVFASSARAATISSTIRPPKVHATIVPPPVSTLPINLTMSQLDQRVATVPALAGAKAGTLIQLSDDGSVTHSIWRGTYVFQPAGSIVQPGPMYLRWKDGIVTITPTPAGTPGQPLPGTLDASYVAQKYDANHEPYANYQTIQTLTWSSADPSVLQIPDGSWLFRVNANGQYVTLVDAFVFQAGGAPVLDQPDVNNVLPAAAGSQPVPVWVNANAS